MDEREIFLTALKISDLFLRKEYVERICEEDSELRDRVNSLIDSLQNMTDSPPFTEFLTLEFSGPNGDARDEKTSQDPMGTHAIETQGAPKTELIKTDTFDETIFRILQKPEQADSVGRLVNYEIKRVIGRGAFGIVLEGFDSKLRRSVAIKVLAPTLTARPDESQRFLSEAQSVAAIRHENVVRIYSIEEEPIPYLVMEYIPGKTLQGLVEETGPLPLSNVLQIGQQIARGLDAAHQKGLVHRDIKPSNILLEHQHDNSVKITDFGLARHINCISSTQGGHIVGTPMYMAPEQAAGDTIDQRSDLFSLGSVLYFMITGRAPFEGDSAVSILNQVSRDTPTPIQSIVPSIPDSLCRIVVTLHSKSPENRFQSAKEVAELLKQCLSEMKLQEFPTFAEVQTPPANGKVGVAAPISSASHQTGSVQSLKKTKPRHWIVIATVPTIALLSYLFIPKAEGEKTLPQKHDSVNSIETPEPRSPRTRSATFSLGRMRTFLNQNAMGDGNLDDVGLEDDTMTFDASDRSPNIWINFHAVAGKELTFTSAFRNLTPDTSGFAKFVYMPDDGIEVCGCIANWDGRSVGFIELIGSRQEQVKHLPLPLVDTGDWTEIKFVVNQDEFLFYVGDELIARSARNIQQSGYVALCVGHWRCQFKNPQVVLDYASRSIPLEKPKGAVAR